MTPAAWGGVLGGTTALGLLLAVARVVAIRRPHLEARVLPSMPPVWHIGGWLKPSVVLLILLILMLWRRGRSERTPAQV